MAVAMAVLGYTRIALGAGAIAGRAAEARSRAVTTMLAHAPADASIRLHSTQVVIGIVHMR